MKSEKDCNDRRSAWYLNPEWIIAIWTILAAAVVILVVGTWRVSAVCGDVCKNTDDIKEIHGQLSDVQEVRRDVKWIKALLSKKYGIPLDDAGRD